MKVKVSAIEVDEERGRNLTTRTLPLKLFSSSSSLSHPRFMAILTIAIAWLGRHRRALAANGVIVTFLILYALVGGVVFLHFEHSYDNFLRFNSLQAKKNCIERLLARQTRSLRSLRSPRSLHPSALASSISVACLAEGENDFRHEWNIKTAALYAFGILTTLGYGKIEPRTRNGRIFTVIYGFIGIPITVILLTNIGRYLEMLALRIRTAYTTASDDMRAEETEEDIHEGATPSQLFLIVLLFLLIGAVCVPVLHGEVDFFNGLYLAFICLTAIEYGELVPPNNWFLPLVIIYVCIGLAISTIALDIGSIYVRKLHYIGQKIKNIANMKIWFGARSLKLSELVNAIGHNIGLEQNIINEIDIDTLVKIAIEVKEGRAVCVPQTHVLEGIWPPELVPLFIKDGAFPLFVDEENSEKKLRLEEREDELPEVEEDPATDNDDCYYSIPPPLPPKRRNTVRFEDEMEADALARLGRPPLSSPPPLL